MTQLNGINKGINKVNKEENQMPYLGDRKFKDTQSEWQEKRSQDYNNNLRSLRDTIKGKSICVIGVPEGKQDVEQLFEEIMMENFPSLVKDIDIKPRKLRESPKPGIQRGPHQDTS